MLGRHIRWPLRRGSASPLALGLRQPYRVTVLSKRVEIGIDLTNGLRGWIPLLLVEALERSLREAGGHGQRVPGDAAPSDSLPQRGNDLAPLSFELVDVMLHAEDRTVAYYGASSDSSGLRWKALAGGAVSQRMRDADQVRAGLQRYMAQHGLTPHRWSTDAGLSERALPHFIDGRSKSMTPSSLQKLARARQATIRDIVGFVPDYTEEDMDAPEAESPSALSHLTDLVLSMHSEMKSLREEVRELRSMIAKADEQ